MIHLTSQILSMLLALAPAPSDSSSVAGISFRALPKATRVQLELSTSNGNAYRVNVQAMGETNSDVREAVKKELIRHHWSVEGDVGGLVLVRGYKPIDGPQEGIAGLTVTMFANEGGIVPAHPGIGHPSSIRCKVLIQTQPGPNLTELP